MNPVTWGQIESCIGCWHFPPYLQESPEVGTEKAQSRREIPLVSSANCPPISIQSPCKWKLAPAWGSAASSQDLQTMFDICSVAHEDIWVYFQPLFISLGSGDVCRAVKHSPGWKTQCNTSQLVLKTNESRERGADSAAAAGFGMGLRVPVYRCGLRHRREARLCTSGLGPEAQGVRGFCHPTQQLMSVSSSLGTCSSVSFTESLISMYSAAEYTVT